MTHSVRLWTAVREDRPAVYSALVDYRQLPRFVDGLVSLEPLSAASKGPSSVPAGPPAGPARVADDPGSGSGPLEGSEFAAVMHLGPKQVHSTLELSRLVPPELVVWTSLDADDRQLSFTLADGDATGQTKILLAVSYALPGGIKGVLVAPMVEQTVRTHARATLQNLKEHFGAA